MYLCAFFDHVPVVFTSYRKNIHFKIKDYMLIFYQVIIKCVQMTYLDDSVLVHISNK